MVHDAAPLKQEGSKGGGSLRGGCCGTPLRYLNLVRIYTKPKGQLPDYNDPVIIRSAQAHMHPVALISTHAVNYNGAVCHPWKERQTLLMG